VSCWKSRTVGRKRYCQCHRKDVLDKRFEQDFEKSCENAFSALVDFRFHAQGTTCRNYCHQHGMICTMARNDNPDNSCDIGQSNPSHCDEHAVQQVNVLFQFALSRYQRKYNLCPSYFF
jgi:hypothetical protein